MENKGVSLHESVSSPTPLPKPPPKNQSLREGIRSPGDPQDDTFRLVLNGEPKSLPNWRIEERALEWLQEKVRTLVKEGMVSPVVREPRVLSPCHVIWNGVKFRFRCDFKRTLNPFTENDTYPLPLIQPLLQRVARGKFFAKIDLTNGFWHVRTEDDATRDLLGFEVPGMGYFVWNRLAQGLKQSPSIFQRYMERVLKGLDVQPYIDDIILSAGTTEELILLRDRVLKRLAENNLRINKDKSALDPQESIDALGFSVRYNSVLPRDEYVEATRRFQVEGDAKSLRKFLGRLSFLGIMYPHIQAEKNVLFTALRRKRFRLGERERLAISSIKENCGIRRVKKLPLLRWSGLRSLRMQTQRASQAPYE